MREINRIVCGKGGRVSGDHAGSSSRTKALRLVLWGLLQLLFFIVACRAGYLLAEDFVLSQEEEDLCCIPCEYVPKEFFDEKVQLPPI